MDVYYLPPPEQARYSCRSIYRTAQYSRSITSVSARSGRTALKACVLAVAAAISASAGAAYVEIITNADYGNSYPPKIELTEETTAGEINIDVETISERDNYTLNVKNGLTVEGDAVMRINAVGEDGTDGGGALRQRCTRNRLAFPPARSISAANLASNRDLDVDLLELDSETTQLRRKLKSKRH